MRLIELTTLTRPTQGPQGQMFTIPSHPVYLDPKKILSLEPAWGPSKALQGELVIVGTMINLGQGIGYVVQEPLSEVLDDIENAISFPTVTNH